jgi:hypothetical protein
MAGWRRSFGLEACGVLASSRRPQRGRRSSLRQEVSLAGGFLRAGGCMEGRSSFWREVGLDVAKKQAVACRDRPCPELSFGPEAATGVFVRLEGRRQARGRSSRLDGKGVEMIFGTQAGWCGGKPMSGRCLTGLSFLLEAAAGGLVRLEGLKPAALTSGPEGRRWIWPSRGRHCAIRHLLAGGTNEDAHAPTTTPSPAGRSASSSEAPAFSARPVCV